MCQQRFSPGLGTYCNPQDQIENKLAGIGYLLVNAPTEFVGYLKLTKVLQIFLMSIWIANCCIANQFGYVFIETVPVMFGYRIIGI